MKTANLQEVSNGFELSDVEPVELIVPDSFKPRVCINGCICSGNNGTTTPRVEHVQSGDTMLVRIFSSQYQTVASDVFKLLRVKNAVYPSLELLKMFVRLNNVKENFPAFFGCVLHKPDNRLRRAGDTDSGSEICICIPRNPIPLTRSFCNITFPPNYPWACFTRKF